MLVEIVRASTSLHPDERAAVGIDMIAIQCRQALVSALEQPPRTPDDWSITEFEPGGCCDDCATLTDPIAQTHTFPLAKPRRQHIHHRIDDAELSVTHRTRREGNPNKLVLTKTGDLHSRDTEHRATLANGLVVIEQCRATSAAGIRPGSAPGPSSVDRSTSPTRTRRRLV